MNTQYRKNLKAVLEASKTYCDESIESLKWELGTYDLSVDTDTTTAYQKVVPSGSIEAKINTLGGMSYNVNQLISNGNFATPTGWGVNVGTLNFANNTLTLSSGTGNRNSLIKDISGLATLNHKYLILFTYKSNKGFYLQWLAGNNSVNASNNFTVFSLIGTYSNSAFGTSQYLYNYDELTDNEWVLELQKFMLFDLTAMGIDTNDVSVATSELLKRGIDINTYQAYDSSSIRDSVVSSVVSEGTNLCEMADKASTTTNGITYKIENGAISVSGSISDSYSPQYLFIEIPLVNTIPSGTYSINWFNDTTNNNLYCYNADLSNIGDYTLARFLTTTNASASGNMANGIAQIRLRFEKTYTYNLTIKPMIVKGSIVPTTYIPYYTSSLLINASIQALDGYGMGYNETCNNYIDFNSKKFVKMYHRYTFTGNESWNYNSTAQRWQTSITVDNSLIPPTNNTTKAMLSVNVKVSVISNTYQRAGWEVFGTTGKLNFYINDSDELPSTTNPNTLFVSGKTLDYELATPVETDISAYITTNKIEVEGGGTLTAENTYSAYVPSDIDYLKEVAK